MSTMPSKTITEEGVKPKVDVILGQGAVALKYSAGTFDYRKLVDENEQAYASEKKKFKKYIPQTIVAIILSRGGRYLERIHIGKKTYYKAIGNKAAVEKTAQALRDARKKRKLSSDTGPDIICVCDFVDLTRSD